MMPGGSYFNSPSLVVTRFTAPNAGTFNITGSFTDLQRSSVSLAILVAGVTAFNSSFAGRSPYQGTIPFSINDVRLTPRTIIDFVIDSGPDGQPYDVVGLMATISTASGDGHSVAAMATPIPGVGLPGLGLILAGSGLLGWWRRVGGLREPGKSRSAQRNQT
jgi:hypothetical protein